MDVSVEDLLQALQSAQEEKSSVRTPQLSCDYLQEHQSAM